MFMWYLKWSCPFKDYITKSVQSHLKSKFTCQLHHMTLPPVSKRRVHRKIPPDPYTSPQKLSDKYGNEPLVKKDLPDSQRQFTPGFLTFHRVIEDNTKKTLI